MKLWNHIRTEVNPSTKVGTCALKDDIESKTLQQLDMDVKGYTAWLISTKKEIICQQRPGKYNDYIQYVIKTYLTPTNDEFNKLIKDVKRKWTQDLLPQSYLLSNLMGAASKTFNNITANGRWILTDKSNNSMSKSGPNSMESKCMALTAKIEALEKRSGGRRSTGTHTNPSTNGVSWRFKNLDNTSEMTKNNRKYKWCSKDYHKKPIWYDRPSCLSKEEFKVKKPAERDGKADNTGLLIDFKVALAAVTSDEDYKALEAQFL